MPSDRIEARFAQNAVAKTGALLPYFTSGFPNLTATADFIRAADSVGVTAIELGLPYSDSIADGPVIQGSFNYVLSRGQRLVDSFRMVSELRPSVTCALVAMVSFSLVHRFGSDAFMDQCVESGFDGVIVPDLPVEESASLSAAVGRAGLCYIGLVAPTTSPKRRDAIARISSGFIYQIAVAGTTGERIALPAGLSREVAELQSVSRLPVCVGFGISSAKQVREVCGLADGAIVGSAIVRRISEALDKGADPPTILQLVSHFLSGLMSGLTPSNQR